MCPLFLPPSFLFFRPLLLLPRNEEAGEVVGGRVDGTSVYPTLSFFPLFSINGAFRRRLRRRRKTRRRSACSQSADLSMGQGPLPACVVLYRTCCSLHKYIATTAMRGDEGEETVDEFHVSRVLRGRRGG